MASLISIKKFLGKMLSNSNEVSATRVMALFALLIGSIIGLYGVIKSTDLSGVAQVCAVFVGSAFAAKLGQKFVEEKKEDK